jgi:hypothetical protein
MPFTITLTGLRSERVLGRSAVGFLLRFILRHAIRDLIKPSLYSATMELLANSHHGALWTTFNDYGLVMCMFVSVHLPICSQGRWLKLHTMHKHDIKVVYRHDQNISGFFSDQNAHRMD